MYARRGSAGTVFVWSVVVLMVLVLVLSVWIEAQRERRDGGFAGSCLGLGLDLGPALEPPWLGEVGVGVGHKHGPGEGGSPSRQEVLSK